MIGIASLILLGCIWGIIATSSRTNRLAQLARRQGYAFEKHKSHVLTEPSAQGLEFFTAFLHRYQNVLTYSDRMAFIRIADDTVRTDASASAKRFLITTFTAEFKNPSSQILKSVLTKSPFVTKRQDIIQTENLALDSRYNTYSSSKQTCQVLSAPCIAGLFKTQHKIYLEITENALVYHEHTLVPVAEIETFRWRGMQLLKELEAFCKKPTHPTLSTDTDTAAEQIPILMLPTAGHISTGTTKSPLWRLIGIFVLLLFLVGLSSLLWFIMRFWINP